MLWQDSILQTTLFGNKLQDYIVAFLAGSVLTVLFWIFKKFVFWKVKDAANRTKTNIDDLLVDVISSIKPLFLLAVAMLLVVSVLNTSDFIEKTIEAAVIIIFVYQAVIISQVILDYFLKRFLLKESDANSREAFKSINRIMMGIIWAFGILLMFQNLGVNISSLLAGLGIGGVAIALASKEILADLFSSLAIIFDKPFVPGDFIIVGEHMGVVEKIGIKTTRIKALQGEEIVISNTELTSTRVQNFKKLRERRVSFNIGVLYQTPHSKLAKIPLVLKAVVEKQNNTRFDRAHFTKLGDSALVYEVVYYALTADYNEYMDIHQNILLATLGEFEKLNVEIAYPTQTILLQNTAK